MTEFARLLAELEGAKEGGRQERALAAFFSAASPEDAAWALWLLCGERISKPCSAQVVRTALEESSGLPGWLLDESIAAAGELAEAAARILPEPTTAGPGLAKCLNAWLAPMPGMDRASQGNLLKEAWAALGQNERVVLNQAAMGKFRPPVPLARLWRAVSRASTCSPSAVALRASRGWRPTPDSWRELCSQSEGHGVGWPICLPAALGSLQDLGDLGEWAAEWHWLGLRALLVRRTGAPFLWSIDGELLDERFPDVLAGAGALAEMTVLDGWITSLQNGRADPGALAARSTRVRPSAARTSRHPCQFVAMDVLELEGSSMTGLPWFERRALLEESWPLCSPLIGFDGAQDLASRRMAAREVGADGLLLKRKSAACSDGPSPQAWRLWKPPTLAIKAALLYAERSPHGGFARLTLGVWDGGQLVSVAKAPPALAPLDLARVEEVVRTTTIERRGPIRVVDPSLVFDLGFDAVHASSRHKCGLVLAGPRLLGLAEGSGIEAAGSLSELAELARMGSF